MVCLDVRTCATLKLKMLTLTSGPERVHYSASEPLLLFHMIVRDYSVVSTRITLKPVVIY